MPALSALHAHAKQIVRACSKRYHAPRSVSQRERERDEERERKWEGEREWKRARDKERGRERGRKGEREREL